MRPRLPSSQTRADPDRDTDTEPGPRPAPRPRRRTPLRNIHVLPTVVTAGNLLAGALGIAYLIDAAAADVPARQEHFWGLAAWMIFIGMFCDGLDGRIARLTRSVSAFGAQLDSLADVITFGILPALLAKTLLGTTFPMIGGKLLMALVVVYVLGAALRLARYNVESARTSSGGDEHMTMMFRGLPSPAAAGVVASLVLLRHEYQLLSLDWAILLGTPLLGLLMISRLPYPHVMNRFLEGNRPLMAVVLLLVTIFLFFVYLLETTAAVFLVYAASGPVLHGLAVATGRLRWAIREDEDEAIRDDVEPPEGAGAGEPESTPPRSEDSDVSGPSAGSTGLRRLGR